MPNKVTGIGGVFIKCEDPAAMRNWYNEHLGLNAGQYGAIFDWREAGNPEKTGQTVWNPFPKTTKYFQPSEKEMMINFRVENLEWLLEELKKAGIEQVGEMQVHEYGKFAHIMDPEGNKIELWEPGADA